MQHVRVDHDPQRQLLQVRELRDDFGLRLAAQLEGAEIRPEA